MNISTILRFRVNAIEKSKITKSLLAPKLYSTSSSDEIIIPKRIPRGPTDILRALESTVDRDPTAAHYKYHDDPYLIPQSNIGKRTFAMAQEAGRKAAHWIRREHSDLFQHREADPPVKMFFPPMVYDENSNVTEEDLKSVISNVQVEDARIIYQNLKAKGIEVHEETMQSLLEMVCYYNSENAMPEEFIEERWFKQSSKGKERQRKTWSDGGFAEEIFISLQNPTSESYSAIIQGMVKHGQVDRAYQLFEEAQQKNIVPNVDAFNAIISVSNFLKESFDMRWAFTVNLLSQMNMSKIRPNIGTLNAVLQTISNTGGSKNSRENALKTLVEFKNLGIEPSLGSWYYLLKIFCKERGQVSTILYDIMREVENKEQKIKDLRDVNFFVTAMDICRYHLQDLELARRVNKLLNFGSNYDLIGDSYKESIYYRHFFVLSCSNEPIEDFIENTYNKLVPHIYVPEPGVMEEVLTHVEASGAIQYVPKLWSDLTVFDHVFKERILNILLNIMVNNEPFGDKEEELVQQFSNIAWDIYSRIEGQHEQKTNRLQWTGDMLGKIMTVVIKNKEFEKASKILQVLDKGHHKIPGVPQLQPLLLYVDLCIEEKAPSKAIACIQYCADLGYSESEDLAKKLVNKMTLDETHLQNLAKIVGEHNLVAKQTNQS